ncbi:MAG: 3-oxoacyl-ACP synthase III [Phycisphaerae bacterium]|nr:3-oxoacyl-ACP synthase III [Phycisphaerae bacterium]
MRYTRTHIAALAYELAPHVVTSDEIEQRLAPVYRALRLQPGQLYALTGIRERRWWNPGERMADAATRAGRRALDAAGIDAADLGMVIYAGVCRDNLEPATACAAAEALGVRGSAEVYDVSNACLGVINGMVHIANAIELGHIRAGLVFSAESSRQIMELTINRMLRHPDMQTFKMSLATMTGGSGAAAVVLTEASLSPDGHALLGGVIRTDPRYHRLCRWGPDTGIPASGPMVMQTDAAAVLEHGVALGVETYREFVRELGWENGEEKPLHGNAGRQDLARSLTRSSVSADAAAVPTAEIEGDGAVITHVDCSTSSQRAEIAHRDEVKSASGPDKVVCHQVGAGHRVAVLQALEIPIERDFSTFEYLGNIGTVSLPLTAAVADERRFLRRGDRVGLLGIGSGLNCLCLGVRW